MAASSEELDLVESDDYYAWLGLNRNASIEEVNNAFRKISRIYHPDKHHHSDQKEKAEQLFTKIKKAHEVLSDPNRKAIYDVMGVKGLETDGWEVVSRNKTPQEILAEYERLAKEKEEKRLEQVTNPSGSVSVGVDATSLFERYDDTLDYGSGFPSIEVTQMSISQSVECPLTTKDTVILAGNLANNNGRGSGHVTVTGRRLTSHTSWIETSLAAGNGATLSVKGFKTLWGRSYGTFSGSLQLVDYGVTVGLKPGMSAMIATQLDKNIQGRMALTWYGHTPAIEGSLDGPVELHWVWDGPSAIQSAVIWDTEKHHIDCTLQLGIPVSLIGVNYVRKFLDREAKVRAGLKAGTFGVMCEYGCEKKITKFSTLGATMMVGIPMGVTLKIKVVRGHQTFLFPIHLAGEVVPEAIVYGTVIPLVSVALIKTLIVNPFLRHQREKELQEKKEANKQRLAEKRREAEHEVELMKETVDRCYEREEGKGGLVIRKAIYGKLQGEDIRSQECLPVTRQLQALVKDSKLLLPTGTGLSELPGFYDPCVGEEKILFVMYEFRRTLHEAKFTESEKILLPNREHLVSTNQSSSSTENR